MSAFPDEEEDTITMIDVLNRESELEEEANAVLGNSDEKNCTYSKGYLPRQAIYSCTTCSSNSNSLAAICLACSLECHENHDLIELYTKRFVRCDCGNSKFKSDFKCKLMENNQEKSAYNEKNKYNHNFEGRYCFCDKRYPPEEGDDDQDDMLQCIACEDWYHTKHLNVTEIPSSFDELICGPCSSNLDFLKYYHKGNDAVSSEPSEQEESQQPSQECSSQQALTKQEKNQEINPESSPKLGTKSCLLETLKETQKEKEKEVLLEGDDEADHNVNNSTDNTEVKPLFWLSCNWRSKLCKCPSCLDMYKSKNCEFLTDESDTIQSYEALGKAKTRNDPSRTEQGLISALGGINRTAAVEAIHGYNALKEDLSNYLRPFADSNRVVREQDIHEFFNQLSAKKRARYSDSP